MINIIIPIAGKAQRFIDVGLSAPKPLIMVKDKHMIDWAMESINYIGCRLIFLVRKDHVNSHAIDKILRNKFETDTTKVEIVIVDKITQGALCTCLLAESLINNKDPLFIYTPDVYFEPKFDPIKIVDSHDDGFLLCFKANSPDHSYAAVGEGNWVVKTAEKEVISNNAAVGVYYFKEGKIFIEYAEEMIRKNITINSEFYICPMYNLMIQDGLCISVDHVKKMHVLGTPKDLKFFTDNTLKKFGEKPIALCCDHSGFKLKEMMKKHLSKHEICYIDFGTYVDFDCDHYDFLYPATLHIKDGICDFGMAFCYTGQGFNSAANKVYGIRSALISDAYTAEYSIRHNCANFFCLSEKYMTEDIIDDILFVLSTATFDGGRHMNRIMKVGEMERGDHV
jgi:RpiB/LacA/LacB family sugar-phosphate isomerase